MSTKFSEILSAKLKSRPEQKVDENVLPEYIKDNESESQQ